MQKYLPFALFLLSISVSWAQDTRRPSPLAIASIRVKDSYIKITYSQPQKRGREIFGKLVPFNQVWRTGANEATEMTLTKDITLNNVLLKAGSYSIFTIPQKDKWTIIVNAELGLWGSYNYNADMDVMRFDVPVQSTTKEIESFLIALIQQNDHAEMSLQWDNVKISIPIKFLN